MADMSESVPIAIIGAGLAGSAAATVLAQAGWQVLLLERDTFPRDKLCGEFLSGEAGRLLRRLGCLDILMQLSPPRISRGNFITPQGQSVAVALPETAYGISRLILDEMLFSHACAAGAIGRTGCDVRIERTQDEGILLHLRYSNAPEKGKPELIKPALTIGAYGRRSKIDKDLDRPFLNKLNGSVGLKLHFTFAHNAEGTETQNALRETTEVYIFAGGYCGINKIENDQVNVCVLFDKKAFAKVASSQWKDVAGFITRQNPGIVKRLAGLVPERDAMLVVSQMPSTMKEQALNGMVFIGDAAGMIAPFCGDGQAMALEAGIMLADAIVDAFPEPGHLHRQMLNDSSFGRRWQKQWRSKFASRLCAGRVIQYAMLRPVLAETTAFALRTAPRSAVNLLAKVTRSHV